MSDGRLHVVTLVDHIGAWGGAERLAAQIAAELDPAGFRSTLCVTRWRRAGEAASDLRAELEAGDVAVLPLGRRGKLDVWSWRPLVEVLRDGTDVVHAHLFGSNLWGTVLGRLARVPVVVAHEHSWSFEGQPLRRRLDRHVIARFSDAFIAVSSEDRRRMMELEGIPEEDIVFVPNGIPDPPPPSGRDVRAELGLAPGVPVVGALGRLEPLKAFETLVEAAALLRERVPGVVVLIAGEGDERPRLEALIAERDLGTTVRLLGFRTDIPDLVAAFDVAAMSSISEGSPLTVMEFMEGARPIVATTVGGVPDLVEDGVHGRLVPPRDPAALAAAVADLLADPEAAAAMGARARERRRREFALSTMVRRLEDLYRELHGRRPSRARTGVL